MSVDCVPLEEAGFDFGSLGYGICFAQPSLSREISGVVYSDAQLFMTSQRNLLGLYVRGGQTEW